MIFKISLTPTSVILRQLFFFSFKGIDIKSFMLLLIKVKTTKLISNLVCCFLHYFQTCSWLIRFVINYRAVINWAHCIIQILRFFNTTMTPLKSTAEVGKTELAAAAENRVYARFGTWNHRSTYNNSPIPFMLSLLDLSSAYLFSSLFPFTIIFKGRNMKFLGMITHNLWNNDYRTFIE